MTKRPSDTLGERLKIAIQDSGHTVSDVATRCDISVQAVYNWYNGSTAELDGKNLAMVADLTGHDPMWLEFGTGPKVRTYARSDRAAKILLALDSLSDTQAAAVEQMVLAMQSDAPRDVKKSA